MHSGAKYGKKYIPSSLRIPITNIMLLKRAFHWTKVSHFWRVLQQLCYKEKYTFSDFSPLWAQSTYLYTYASMYLGAYLTRYTSIDLLLIFKPLIFNFCVVFLYRYINTYQFVKTWNFSQDNTPLAKMFKMCNSKKTSFHFSPTIFFSIHFSQKMHWT